MNGGTISMDTGWARVAMVTTLHQACAECRRNDNFQMMTNSTIFRLLHTHSYTRTLTLAQKIVLNSLLLTISTSFVCLLVLRRVEEDEELVSIF